MKKRLLSLFCILLLTLSLPVGCAQAALPPEEEYSSSLLPESPLPQQNAPDAALPELFSLPYEPNLTLDPVTCTDGMQQVVASLIFEGLFRLSPSLEAEPLLCESYTYDEETLTYVFTLRSGIVFSDSSPLTAADVAGTLKRAKTDGRYAARLSQVTSISTEENSVVVQLSAPNSDFPALLDIPITSNDENGNPIGTGPYLFSLENSNAYLIANQSWWQGTHQPTDRISLIEASDQDTLLYRFTSHDVQLITADMIGIDSFTAVDNVACQDVNTTILQYIGCNVTRAPLNDASFRRALSAGINRANMVNAYMAGHGLPASFPVSPASPLYPEELEQAYSHNGFLEKLAECEALPENPLTLLVNAENPFKVQVAQQIANAYTQAGVVTELHALPWEEYLNALTTGDFDLYYGEVRLTADWDLTALLQTGGALNYGGWASTMTDQHLTSFAASSDRKAAMTRLCTYLQAQAPILPVCFKSTSVLTQPNVVELTSPTMNEPFYRLSDCVMHLQTP